MRATFNIEWNKHVLRPTNNSLPDSVIIKTIKEAIFIATGKEFHSYNIKNRRRSIIILKFAFFKLARTYSDYTYDDIGKIFYNNLNHSSVIHGCKTIDDIEYMGDKDERFKTWNNINNTFKKLIKYK